MITNCHSVATDRCRAIRTMIDHTEIRPKSKHLPPSGSRCHQRHWTAPRSFERGVGFQAMFGQNFTIGNSSGGCRLIAPIMVPLISILPTADRNSLNYFSIWSCFIRSGPLPLNQDTGTNSSAFDFRRFRILVAQTPRSTQPGLGMLPFWRRDPHLPVRDVILFLSERTSDGCRQSTASSFMYFKLTVTHP